MDVATFLEGADIVRVSRVEKHAHNSPAVCRGLATHGRLELLLTLGEPCDHYKF